MHHQPTAKMLANARAVVTDPASFADQPALRSFAWAALMAHRGHSVRQMRLCAQIRAMQRMPQSVPPRGMAPRLIATNPRPPVAAILAARMLAQMQPEPRGAA
jgi:hypothetical protein